MSKNSKLIIGCGVLGVIVGLGWFVFPLTKAPSKAEAIDDSRMPAFRDPSDLQSVFREMQLEQALMELSGEAHEINRHASLATDSWKELTSVVKHYAQWRWNVAHALRDLERINPDFARGLEEKVLAIKRSVIEEDIRSTRVALWRDDWPNNVDSLMQRYVEHYETHRSDAYWERYLSTRIPSRDIVERHRRGSSLSANQPPGSLDYFRFAAAGP